MKPSQKILLAFGMLASLALLGFAAYIVIRLIHRGANGGEMLLMFVIALFALFLFQKRGV